MIYRLVKIFLPVAAFLYVALLAAQLVVFSQSPVDADSITDLKVRVALLEAWKKTSDENRSLLYTLVGGNVLNLGVGVALWMITTRASSKRRRSRRITSSD